VVAATNMIEPYGWLPNLLVLLPLLGALIVWLVPFPRLVAGGVALFFGLAEVAFFGVSLAHFQFAGLAIEQSSRLVWFSDLGVSWHLGFTNFSIWLVGLTVVAMTAAIAYGLWTRRERARAYFGLMLFLTSAIVGVFSAQDLLLFYVFWEAMLIPLYVLVGVWGGPGRMGATLKFVIYTMAGSLLMLASIIVLGLDHHTFDIPALLAGGNTSTWLFLGFAAAFAVKAPLFPLHGWLPDAYREAPAEVSGVLSGVVSKAATYGFLYIGMFIFGGLGTGRRGTPVADLRTPILVLAATGLVYGSLLAFRARDVRGVIAYSSMAQVSLITIGLFATNLSGLNGAVLQMVNHGFISLLLFLLAGTIERRTETGSLERLGGMARGRPALATMLMATGVIALAVPGSTAFAGEFLILAGVFNFAWGYAVVGAVAIVLAAMYMLRLISAVLHRDVGPAVPATARDLRLGELAILVPLLGCLLALSVWPAGITDRAFGQDKKDVSGIGSLVP
jgi:NADH-quinone oxidoreductase subunit M